MSITPIVKKMMIIISILLLPFPPAKGTLFQPNAYTLPDRLQSVNGSSITGGCQESCIQMPISGTSINGCDCPGTTPVSGVLIDGDIPSIDTTQRRTWASGLFVVNRNGQDSFMIGFRFVDMIFVEEVQVKFFDCPLWGAGVTTINVYSSFIFPNFISTASTNISMLSLVGDTSPSCTSLRTISIQVQTVESSDTYFIEFSFAGGSSAHVLNWTHIGEITFSDLPLTTPSSPTITSAVESTDILSMSTEVQQSTTFILSTMISNDTTTTITDDSTTQTTASTPAPATSIGMSTLTVTDSDLAVPITSIAGALAGVIALLILLIIIGVALMSCFYFYNKRHVETLAVRKLQYLVTEDPSHELDSFSKLNDEYRISVAVGNNHYRYPNQAHLVPPVPPRDSISPESDLYSEVRDVDRKGRSQSSPTHVNSGLYEEFPESNYSLIPEASSKDTDFNQTNEVKVEGTDLKEEVLPKKKPNYALIQKQQPPEVPEKSGELKDYLGLKLETEEAQKNRQEGEGTEQPDNEQSEVEEYYSEVQDVKKQPQPQKKISVDNENYALAHKAELQVPIIEVVPAGIYSEVGQEGEGGEEDANIYTDMDGKRTPSRSSARSRRSSCESGLVPLSKPLCDNMEDNPTYETSDSLLNAFISYGEDIYTDPDDRFNSASQQAIYESVYSDSSVQPSMFKEKVEEKVEQQAAKESSSDDEEEKEVITYTPIYILEESSPSPKREPLNVTNANIRGIKVLGTGFFGKVVLADTVGLSLKDLDLSKDDDDKSVSIQVAVKKLKPHASKTTKEAFEKEYKFMARLNHPNVIRLLGVCTSENSQFLMMEHMERGDLNEYLTNFKKIITDGVPQENDILIGTLVYMCSQIASAMNYLVSRNFIHRDLAARNCLVGADNIIKLADFGMSRSLYESHYYIVRGQAVLPVRWMATECFYGKFSAKTDVWAFGVTMWEIFTLAKDRPYSEMEDMELVNDAIDSEDRTLLQQPEHCPDDVYQVMMSCWAREPKDRATFSALYAALAQLSLDSVDDSAI